MRCVLSICTHFQIGVIEYSLRISGICGSELLGLLSIYLVSGRFHMPRLGQYLFVNSQLGCTSSFFLEVQGINTYLLHVCSSYVQQPKKDLVLYVPQSRNMIWCFHKRCACLTGWKPWVCYCVAKREVEMKSWQSHFPFFPKLSAIKVGRVGKKDPSKSFYVSQMMVFTSCPLEGQQGGAGGRCGPGAGFGLEASWLPLPVSSFAWHSADLCLQIVVLIVGFQLFSIESFQQTKCLGYHIQRSSVGASLCPCLPLLQPSGE